MPKSLAYNVSFFGAFDGDLLVCPKLGVRLFLRGGPVPPCGKLHALFTENDLLDCLSKATSLGIESCREELRKVPEPDDHPNHRALGQECRHGFMKSVCSSLQCPVSAKLELLELGELRAHAQEAGNLEALEALIGKPVPFYEILALCGKHSLSLRRGLYRKERVTGLLQGAGDQTKLPIVDVSSRSRHTGGAERVDEMASITVELPKLKVAIRMDSSTSPLTPADAEKVAAAVLSKEDQKLIAVALPVLKRATPAFLKSLLQKLVRHHGALEPGDDDPALPAPRRVLLACSVGILFQHMGSFVPELQTYVRGVVSLLKRAAVIAVEDGYPSEAVLKSSGLTPRELFLLAVAFKDHKHLHPSLDLAKRVASFCLGCMESPRRINWQAMRQRVADGSAGTEVVDEWKLSLDALKELGAMHGDKVMLDSVSRGGQVEFVTWKASPDRPRLPFSALWAVDFHCVRGVVHGYLGGTFAERQIKMFKHFTGVDPRGQRAGYGYDPDFMKSLRPMQMFCWQRMVSRSREAVSVSGEFTEMMHFDSCPIAYMVGDLSCRIGGKDYIVTLGTKDSLAEEVVIARPSRAAKDVLEVPEATRLKAIAEIRAKTFPLSSPFPEATRLRFDGGHWKLALGGKKDAASNVDADDYCGQPLPVVFKEHPPLSPQDDQLWTLAAQTGSGFRKNWWDVIVEKLTDLPSTLLDRVLVMLSAIQADGKIEMPVVALQQGSASSAKDGDELIYRFLLHVAIQCPSALEAEQIPTFQVKSFLHFLFLRRRIKSWIFEAMWQHSTCATASASASAGGAEAAAAQSAAAQSAGSFLKSAERPLKTEQALALGRLKDAKRRVQFLFAPTGAGKTFTAASYLMSLNVETVIWVAPDEAIDALVEELKKCTTAPVVAIDRRRGKAEVKSGAINIVRYDHAKSESVIGALKVWGSRAALVLDEADKLFGETKRSSAMLELAHTSAYVLMMSATVLRSSTNLEPLFAWANLLSDFPTSRKNLFVFFASLVNFQREAAIKQNFVTEYVDVPLTEDYRRAVASRSWGQAAELVYSSLDEQLVKMALAESGTMLVGRNNEHVKKLLAMLHAGASKKDAPNIGDFDAAVARASFAANSKKKSVDGALKVCVIPLSKHRGYNFGKHYQRMVMPPLPSSVSTRVQLFGRLTRMDQKVKEVSYITVIPRRTILELLFDRHRFDDAVQASIEKLGQRFGHLAQAMLDTPSEEKGTKRSREEPVGSADSVGSSSSTASLAAGDPAPAAATAAATAAPATTAPAPKAAAAGQKRPATAKSEAAPKRRKPQSSR